MIKAILNLLRALVGAILILLFHLPKLIYLLLQMSYAAVFNNPINMTADPKVHLKRASKLLNKKQNSLLPYAALELRFALERISKSDLYITSISNKTRKMYEPAKHISALRNTEPDSSYEHNMFLYNKETGAKIDRGKYKPLDQDKVATITGKLGDILHPKVGLPLGVTNCEWYRDTRGFLWETHHYLKEIIKDRRPYLGEKGFDQIWVLQREV